MHWAKCGHFAMTAPGPFASQRLGVEISFTKFFQPELLDTGIFVTLFPKSFALTNARCSASSWPNAIFSIRSGACIGRGVW